ncbi:MAG: tRNA guanosine(34) transglycosylase Tgt [Candidatus Sungbacteria bacterium]|nr:tRNA guanosine(34) transglycosylase Tgt [Candidatus Sungbacteria bacterium]
MIEFTILKTSKRSRARIGVLKTPHGEIETPSLVPVATQATVKTLTGEELLQTKTQILIANTFHLHTRPGENIVRSAGGLHRFMSWKRPLMTDSGGFQVFSLGFGHDLNVGKILKYFPGRDTETIINKGARPSRLNITEEGVYFLAPASGHKLFLGPKESIAIQEKLGADIIFTFDECTAPLISVEYAKSAVGRTHRWAKLCQTALKGNQALFGIVQGSRFKELREKSAKFINSLDFPGFGIGGDLGHDKAMTKKILSWTLPLLHPRKPRHLLGIGYLEDIPEIIKSGIDLFDCTVPTHYARRGIAFTSDGRLNLLHSTFLKDKKPLDPKCPCQTCRGYRRNYISHLIRAREITASCLLTLHNLYFFNNFVEGLREKIKKGNL